MNEIPEKNIEKEKNEESKEKTDEVIRFQVPLLTDLIKKHYIRRVSLGNVIKYLNTKNNLYYSVIEVLGADKCLLNKIKEYSQLSPHQSIVQCFGTSMENNTIYIFMEYFEGESLKDFLSTHGPLDYKSIVRFTMQILEGLNFLHENGIIPKNISSSNIFMDGLENVKLDCSLLYSVNDSGLGSSMLSNSTTSSGSGCEEYGIPTDKRSLGVIVAHMLTGKNHYTKQDIDNAINKSLFPDELKVFFKTSLDTNIEDHKQIKALVQSKEIEKMTPIKEYACENSSEYIKYCMNEIGLDKFNIQNPISKIKWVEHIERKIGSNILSEKRLEGIYRVVEEIIKRINKNNEKKRDNITYFIEVTLLFIYSRLFENKLEKESLFNKEESFNYLKELIYKIYKLKHYKCESFNFLIEWTNSMKNIEGFLEDILKEYSDIFPLEDHEPSENDIIVYMVNLEIKEKYDKKSIFSKMDYRMIFWLSKDKTSNNLKSNIVQKIINIFNNMQKAKILNARSLSKDQKIAINCLSLTLKGSLDHDRTQEKDSILNSMLSLLEDVYSYLLKNIAALRIAEIILYEICKYKRQLSKVDREKLKEICNKYVSTEKISEEIKLSSSVLLCFTILPADISTNLKIAVQKLQEILENMSKTKRENYLGFTFEEIKETISEVDKSFIIQSDCEDVLLPADEDKKANEN